MIRIRLKGEGEPLQFANADAVATDDYWILVLSQHGPAAYNVVGRVERELAEGYERT